MCAIVLILFIPVFITRTATSSCQDLQTHRSCVFTRGHCYCSIWGPKWKIRHGSLMQNIVINVCQKFHYDRMRNDRALGNGKSDNNKNPRNKNNIRSHWGPVLGPEILFPYSVMLLVVLVHVFDFDQCVW